MGFSPELPSKNGPVTHAPAKPMAEALTKEFLSDSRAVAGGILASRITGLGRIATAAAVLGPTFFGNLFQTAAILPSTVYGLLMGTLITAVLVPPLVRTLHSDDPQATRRFAQAALGIMLLVLGGIAALFIISSPLLLRLITASVVDPDVRRQQIHLGVPLLVMVMPQMALYGLAGAGLAVQQANGRFALSAAAPALENLINIAVLLTSAFLFGIGRDVSDITLSQLLLLGLGTTTAVAVHAGVQWFGAYRLGVTLIPRIDRSCPEISGLVRRGTAMAGYTALYWVAYLITLVIAGTIPGGVAAFQIASSFCALPIVLIAVPLASAQLPRLARNADFHDSKAFSTIYQDGLRLMTFGVVPAALLISGIPITLAGATSFGAMDTTQGIALIGACLGSLGIGIIGEATYTLTTPSCYAHHDAASPTRAMGLRLVIVAIGAIAARLVLSPGLGLLSALCLSLAVANLLAGVLLSQSLLRGLQSRMTLKGSGLLSAFLVAAVSILPARLLGDWLAADAATIYQRAALAAAASGVAMALYFAIQSIRGAQEIRLLMSFSEARWAAAPNRAETG